MSEPDPEATPPSICWTVTDGRAGIENQALGLAEEIARRIPLRIVNKRVAIAAPWRYAPDFLWGDPFERLLRSHSLLRPPFPDLWIGCGRLSAAFTIAVKKRSPATFTTQLQNPRRPFDKFDLIIPPEHDRIRGDNVVSIIGAPHRLHADRLAEADASFSPDALAPPRAPMDGPRVAVLIGGGNAKISINNGKVRRFLVALDELVERGAHVMATASRRTPSDLIDALHARATDGKVYFWAPDRTVGPNPYFAMLARADFIIVTSDSVNMAAEAASIGTPLHIYQWSSVPRAPHKFDLFHKDLYERGAARPYRGALERWAPTRLCETERAADAVLTAWRSSTPKQRLTAGAQKKR